MADESVHINIEGDALVVIQQLRAEFNTLIGRVDVFEDSVTTGMNKLKTQAEGAKESLSLLAMDVLGRSVDMLGAPLRNGADALYAYDEALTELSAITDITGPRLDRLGEIASDMAAEFGGTPQGHIDSYTKLLGALDPAIAGSEEAMTSFGRTNAMLANTMEGDAVGAVKALETVMNQYGVSLADPIEASRQAASMANVMAAAAKAGKVEVPGLTDAMTRSGAEAAAAGVQFGEYAAGIEVAGKFFGSTERLGTAMRGVMSTIGGGVLPESTLNQLADAGVNMETVTNKSLSLKERLTELKKIAGDGGLMEKVFGAGETTAGRGLLQNLDLLDKYQHEIETTPDALEQMNERIMGSFSKQKELIDNTFASMRLSVFKHIGGALPYLDLMGGAIGDVIQLAPGIMAMSQAYKALANSERLAGIWAGAASIVQWGFAAAVNATIWPVVAVVGAVALLTAGAVYAWNEFENFRGVLYGLGDAALAVFNNILVWFRKLMAPVMEALGLWSEEEVTKTVNIKYKDPEYDYKRGHERGVKAVRDRKAEKEKEKEKKTDPFAAMIPPTADAGGIVPPPAKVAGGTENAGGGGSGKGGGTSKSVTVSIQNLIGSMTFSVTGGKINEAEVREQVKRAMIGAVRDFEVAI